MSNTYSLKDRIHGGLAGAAIGDALGAATETVPRALVKERYGWLDEFVSLEQSPLAIGLEPGSFTDDTSLMLAVLDSCLRAGAVGVPQAVEGLLAWESEYPFVDQFVGPSTRAALTRLRNGEDPLEVGRGSVMHGTGMSNGAAMRSAPAGWFYPGDIHGAVRASARLSAPSHNTQIAIAGAAAIASGCAVAVLENSTVEDVVDACLKGAESGWLCDITKPRQAAGPVLARRIELALEIAHTAPTLEECVDEIASVVGSGLDTCESVAAAVGIFARTGFDIRQTVIACANLGDDADTVGTMAGALAGSLSGIGNVPDDLLHKVMEVNQVDFAVRAANIVGYVDHALTKERAQ